MASWDIKGKVAGMPLCYLLGGRLREEVPFAAYIFYRHANPDGFGRVADADEVVAYTKTLQAEHNFPAIKFKGGVLRPEEELDALRALRKAFPDKQLRYDPKAVLSAVFERLAPPRAVYVSCNLDMLVVELLTILNAGYRVERVEAVDMFPHTDHIETVLRLVRC